MKPKITRTGSVDDIHINLASDSNTNSIPGGPSATPSKLNFTDLYLRDSQGDRHLGSCIKTKIVRTDNEPFRDIIFQITVLNYRGFFKDCSLCIRYRNANSSITENFYPIVQKLPVGVSVPLQDVLDLTQVFLSVRSKNGVPLRICPGAYGLEAAEELKVDLTSISQMSLFVNDQVTEENETPRPIGWISYNTQNIHY